MGDDELEEPERSVRGWDRRNEAEAGRLLQHYLGGSVRRIDPGGGATQLHDLELVLSSEEILVVEVTQSVDVPATEALRFIQDRTWSFDGLAHGWQVGYHGAPRVDPLHKRLPVLLGCLEVRGEHRWLVSSSGPRPDDDVLGELHDLGVRAAYVDDICGEPGMVLLSESAAATWFDGSDVVDLAIAEATKPDNVAKLSAAVGSRRVLFIWIGNHVGAVSAALSYGELPEEHPDLPGHLDEIWLATAGVPAKVWRWNCEGWQALEDYDRGIGVST